MSSVSAWYGVYPVCRNTFEWKFPVCDVRLGRFLVRVGTITQRGPLNRPSELFWVKIAGSIFLPEISTDSIVIFRCHFERLERKFAPKLLPNIPLTVLPSFQEVIIIGGIGKNGDPFVILRRSTEERNASDINLLDRIFEGAPRFCDGLGERIEVANDDRDGRNRLSLEILFV